MDAEVILVGYGPVGAVLAALLGSRGVRVLVLEREHEVVAVPRAIAADDEVLRVLAGLPGLGGPGLGGLVNGLQRAAFVDARLRVLADMAFGESRLGQPGLAFFHQPSLERALRAGVAGLGSVRVRLGAEVVAVDAATGEVGLAGGERLRGRWVVGCDGAGSTVRRLAGQPFDGRTFARPWLVVDADLDAPLRWLPYFCYVCDPARPAVTMPRPGGHRWEWLVLPGEDPRQLAAPDSVRGLLARYVDPDAVRVRRAQVYTFHARTARRWRVGRVLLAGDAAHCMPAFAGQGLGAGIRDAAALAWRLAEALAGVSAESLVDQYEAERRPHVAAMTELASAAGVLLQSTGRVRSAVTRAALRAARLTPVVGRLLESGAARPVAGLAGVLVDGVAPGWAGYGEPVPNPRVRTLDGRVALLDEVLPARWALVGSAADPGAGDAAVTEWLARRGGSRLAVVRPGGLRAVAAVGCAAVEDIDGWLLELLRRGGPDPVAIVRPDRFLLGVTDRARVGPALRSWPSRVLTPGPPDSRTRLIRSIARLGR